MSRSTQTSQVFKELGKHLKIQVMVTPGVASSLWNFGATTNFHWLCFFNKYACTQVCRMGLTLLANEYRSKENKLRFFMGTKHE
ncbi:hypothetical protein PHAVU_011G084800 [Phaseolus vulgaris]|uniref:Uncharacterized protein n=1 Tax=Phaseolus vulgaris TaxID=3885 RepID=V7AFK2_PHAVU|nr:hypothetical protein PHAVU_011G084800g [Phaseolus vulgaris]ESW04314.1 hypothetical protein PHAVU_011G084800g [Phaseolus vulgaris]